jgi:hypothetical protein
MTPKNSIIVLELGLIIAAQVLELLEYEVCLYWGCSPHGLSG